jgi:hypothetical protein
MKYFEGIEECLSYQAAPYDGRFQSWQASAAACEIEAITPAIFGIVWRPVLGYPLEAPGGFISVRAVSGELVHL